MNSDPSTATPRRGLVSTILCWAVIAGFVGFMFWSQSRQARLASIAAANSVTAPNLGLDLTGRLAVAQAQLLSNDHSPQGLANQDRLNKQLLQNVNALAVSPLDKLKAAVVVRELEGNAAALAELDGHKSLLGSHTKLVEQAAVLRSIYSSGPQSITAEQRDSLKTSLGWFGELAVTQGRAGSEPDRAEIMQSAKRSYLILMGAVAVLFGGLFIGFLLLILAVVLFAMGKIRSKFQPLEPIGQPVLLETFALWGAAYLLLSFSMHRWKSGGYVLMFEGLFLLLSFLVALWPLLRGFSWLQLRVALGWHAGAGLITEMGIGALGYIAGLPVIAVGVLLTLILSKVGHANPTHPIQMEFAGPMTMGKFFSLLFAISIAAPLLEETMFRGALYAHLRRRWWPWLSAILVSILFAAIHPQGWAGIPVLASIALVLATLREWRGSLVASMTAHGINNGAVLSFVLLVLK